MLVYWISILISDFIKFSFLIILIYPFLIYKYQSLIYSLSIIFFFIISTCLFNYILSHLFETEISGQKFSLLIIYLGFFIFIFLDLYFNTNNLIPGKDDKGFQYKFYFSDLFPSSQLGISLWMIIK